MLLRKMLLGSDFCSKRESDEVAMHALKAWNNHRGVSNSFPGLSPSSSSLEGGLWFIFPGSEAREGGAEL